MVQFEIVVAKYKENMYWTKDLPCIIYNKGDNQKDEYIQLQNVGREAHTYLHHIVSRYDNLSDYTIFVQGNPFDHSPNILTNIQILSRMSELPDFMYLSEKILPTSSEQDLFYLNNRMLPMKEFHTYLFGETKRRNFVFGAGAQFVVSKKLIRNIPLVMYQKLLSDSVIGSAPWCLERFWEQIFMAGTGEVVPPLKCDTSWLM